MHALGLCHQDEALSIHGVQVSQASQIYRLALDLEADLLARFIFMLNTIQPPPVVEKASVCLLAIKPKWVTYEPVNLGISQPPITEASCHRRW